MKKNYVINYACALLALILLIIGIGVFFINVKAPEPAKNLESFDMSEIEPLEYYYAEFLVVDVYSYYGDNVQRATSYNCYAIVYDKNGEPYTVSFSISEEHDIFRAVKLYACDEEAEIGECIVKCYAKAQNISAYSDSIERWYGETVTDYAQYIGISKSAPINFEYYCGGTQNYTALKKAEQKGVAIIAMICTILGAAAAVAAFLVPPIEQKARLTTIGSQAEEKSEDFAEAPKKEENNE